MAFLAGSASAPLPGRKILKYTLGGTDLDVGYPLDLPASASFLHALIQQEGVSMWFMVDTGPQPPTHKRVFYLTGTGHALPPTYHHLATIQADFAAKYIWHIGELIEPVSSTLLNGPNSFHT